VSGIILWKTGRGPGWFFGRLRLGSLVDDSHGSQYESSLVVKFSSKCQVDNIEDKIQGCSSKGLYTVL
jgi:hypothetical protein